VMKDYKIRIKLKSAFGTPWQSDTIFGHLCWQVAYGVLDLTIEEFLKPFLEGNPPFILSDGFPVIIDEKNKEINEEISTVPKPLLKMPPMEIEDVNDYRMGKKRKKSPYLSIDDFLKLRRGEILNAEPLDDPWELNITSHASLDRNSFTTGDSGEGGFYDTEEYVLPQKEKYRHIEPAVEIYLRVEDGWVERVGKLFEGLSTVGYGRDKSVGLGVFKMDGITEFDGFADFEGANGFISLSTMVPAESDPTDARYRLRVKYGKVGEGAFISVDDEGQINPFKRPLLQMEPGAVFRVDGGIKPFYGRMVKDVVHGRENIVQNCYSLAVPCIVGD